MKALLDLAARHKAGEPCAIYSVCSAHPLVIEATLLHTLRCGAPFALIEATSNQVNQEGGYTGMQPESFRRFVHGIADRVGLARDCILLGGDHLGPNPWQALPGKDAMARAEALVNDYVRVGFRKMHLDCSMRCADDPATPSDETIARRAARLCAIAEAAHADARGEPPVYVIGTEVPTPGGAAEELSTLAVTTPEAARRTIDTHRAIFVEAGLGTAWSRVIAAVVQPGVEFNHRKVVAYDSAKARALSRMIEAYDGLVFEAHSTDYQTPSGLAALVRDHFAILKVGPALTFALREALWALDAIEREWIGPALASGFRDTVMDRLKADPRHWNKYYHARGIELEYELQYSLSDRIRYYWSDPQIVHAQGRMFRNLTRRPPPDALISQYLPIAHAALRDGWIKNSPSELAIAHVSAVLDGYQAAACLQGRCASDKAAAPNKAGLGQALEPRPEPGRVNAAGFPSSPPLTAPPQHHGVEAGFKAGDDADHDRPQWTE
ncbi:MAG TPA: D-tagatose-bisphosphate aldolase, class II, non-catalytic subunit [Xanthobacteraceae bacterium]|jgi:D-tagatose-1,6-bisphosphate aldolase subunit GatZ/KbaZ